MRWRTGSSPASTPTEPSMTTDRPGTARRARSARSASSATSRSSSRPSACSTRCRRSTRSSPTGRRWPARSALTASLLVGGLGAARLRAPRSRRGTAAACLLGASMLFIAAAVGLAARRSPARCRARRCRGSSGCCPPRPPTSPSRSRAVSRRSAARCCSRSASRRVLVVRGGLSDRGRDLQRALRRRDLPRARRPDLRGAPRRRARRPRAAGRAQPLRPVPPRRRDGGRAVAHRRARARLRAHHVPRRRLRATTPEAEELRPPDGRERPARARARQPRRRRSGRPSPLGRAIGDAERALRPAAAAPSTCRSAPLADLVLPTPRRRRSSSRCSQSMESSVARRRTRPAARCG